jgi:hypothetical protein
MEFTYNNNDQAIIEMVSYKGLYNRKCRTPICWDDMSDRNLIMLELVLVIIKKIKIIKDIIKATQDRKKKNVIRIIEGGLSGLTLEIGCF